jgi:hypothetical protein
VVPARLLEWPRCPDVRASNRTRPWRAPLPPRSRHGPCMGVGRKQDRRRVQADLAFRGTVAASAAGGLAWQWQGLSPASVKPTGGTGAAAACCGAVADP